MEIALYILAAMFFLMWISPFLNRGRKGFIKFGLEWEDHLSNEEPKELEPWEIDKKMSKIGKRGLRYKD